MPRSEHGPPLVLGLLVGAALAVRWWLLPVVSGDYTMFLARWYAALATAGGLPGLGMSIGNYNTPYLALMALLTYLPVEPLVAIKGLSVGFDLVLAGFAYAIVRELRPHARWLPTLAVGAVLLLPTVTLNGAAWAQCDAIYAAFILASVYFLITRRPWAASAAFGLAFAFKLQAVFFLPVLVVVLIVLRLRLRTLLAVPAAFLAALLPALLAGRSLLSQLAIYPAQVSGSSGSRPGGRSYTWNAPTPYAWLPNGAGEVWLYAGLAVAAAVALGFGVWLLARRRPLSPGQVLRLAATATLVVPILLPEMHERYFYLAEVLTVLAAFVDRRYAVVAAALQLASVSTYLGYLYGRPLVPLEVAAGLATGAAALSAVLFVGSLRQNRVRAAQPIGRDPDRVGRDPVPQRQA